MTLCVSGIPKRTCTSRDIQNIFNSVAQVKRVEIYQEQGRARIELFDKASTTFVLNKKWRINGSELHVADSQRTVKRRRNRRPTNEIELESARNVTTGAIIEMPYQLYKKNANSFWADVPHHNCSIKTKKAKCKFHAGITKRKCVGYEVDTCKNKRTVKNRKSKKSNKNRNIVSNHHSSLKLEDFISYVDQVIKEIRLSNNLYNKAEETPGNKHDAEEEKNKHVLNKKLNSSKTCFKTPVNCKYHVIPLCVLCKEKITVIWCDTSSTSLFSLKEKIKAEIGIPPDLQLLLYRGMLLDQKCILNFNQYENIHLLVKGKGGMQCSELGISRSSSEEQVERWLKQEIGLEEDFLKKFSFLKNLDGETLFSYNEDRIGEFTSDTNIPIGLARKILAFRDKIFEGKSNSLFEYTPEMISAYLRKVLNVSTERNESIEKLCDHIIKKHIDGFVFYIYMDYTQFQSDIGDKEIVGMYFRKAIVKRNAEFQIHCPNDPTTHDLHTKQVPENLLSTENATKFSEKANVKLYKEVLYKLLSLNDIQGGGCEPCQVRLLYGRWKKMNELEKLFVFFFVCREDEYTEKTQQNGLWKQIKNNMNQWFDLLPQNKKELFKESKSGVYTYNRKSLQLSEQCKTAWVMDKPYDSFLKFDASILLISKNVLRSRDNRYVSKLSSNSKSPEEFHFSFKTSERYFTFDPDNYSSGFQRENIFASSADACDRNTVEKVIYTRMSEAVEENLCKAKETKSVSDVGEINSDKTGINLPKAIKAEPEKHDTETPRKFKEGSDRVMYDEGKIFLQPEDDGTLSNRCIEFKSFFTAKENKFVKFQNEVIRFACGCLNARKNGTIYFGVADSVQKIDGKTYKHGEIVGFSISEIGLDSRPTYTDALREGISNCFDGDVHRADVAKKCISNPIFVKVVIPGRSDFKYVMEVDVEPSSNLCKGDHFTVNLKKIRNQTNKSVKNASVLFLRKGSSTEQLESDKMLLFTKLQLPEFIAERKNFEEHNKNKTVLIAEDPATKLERLLTRGFSKLDKRFWPLLVLGKPNKEQKQNVKWCESMSFIRLIKLIAVFDFDDSSNEDGLCSFYRNPERSLICTESMFRESSGNLQELANTLGLPYEDKTVWIFANGRTDSSEVKLHLDRSDWHESYSAGVCDAVSFFNQNFVIQKGREIIIVLLFSHDFDGVIDTFNEITKTFGWGPLVIIAEQKRIFDDFAEKIQKEGKGSKEHLEKVAVTGMLWEHVNSTITSLTGYDEKLNCVLPCSSGAYVKAEERFIESLADLSILSAKQCENKKFNDSRERKKFALDQEIQFYKGQRVTWWNFYFNSQVCLRYRYKTIQEKALVLLRHSKEETRKVVTLIIAHEPGAGATTLGYQLLWDFRHKYRCCVVKKLSEMTIMQISFLWKYKEDIESDFQPNPIVLFLDDIQSELSVFEFTRQLIIEFRKNDVNNGMNCLIIICQREEQLVDHEHGRENIFYLKQELSDEEKTWFADKFDELERTGQELDLEDYKPQHLISFMIMRSEFNPEYIKNTIQHLISTIDQKSNEYKLLKYLSFLATYTPFTRRGAKVFVPVECCDELMGKKHRFWEEHLSNPLRVLLIFEEKEQASGRQVRIAHPSLGEVILSEIIKNEKVELAEIAREYLCCSLLKNTAYGRKLLVEFTLDMLKRRKKEEYDEEKVTKFSPLIQKIVSDSTDNCDKAADILKLGYKEFQDPILAQTLARLYLGYQMFDEAITWAKEAADLSSKSSKSYILHTYGLVLREKFKHFTEKNVFRPRDAYEYLKLILKSLDAFLQAAVLQEDETDTQKLLNLYYAINNINEITSFLTDHISYDAEETNIIRYLKDKNYIPGEIFSLWESFHKELKGMRKHAQDAFKVLEDNVCFHSVFYAPEFVQSTSQQVNENRFYRRFHFGYEDMLKNYSRIYGETSSPVDGGNDAANDCYHRGRLWTLKGHSYMSIFDHLKHMDENQSKVKHELCEIKDHIAQIKFKDVNDLANQVCVNVALGIVGYRHRDSESSILKTCNQIIAFGDNSNKKVDLAYFFVSMLLWPGGAMHPSYDDSLLQASLSYLKKKQQRHKPIVKKYESKSQPTTQFFLAKGEGLESLCHRWQTPVFIQNNTNSPSWDDKKTKEKLRRLSGKIETKGYGSSSIVVDGNHNANPIKISKIRGPTTGFRSDEEVTFYLGFSIAGPIAYNVKLKSDGLKHSELCSQIQFPPSRVQEYIKQPIEELRKMLLKIKRIEWKRQDYLTEREKQLLNDKNDIREAIDRQEIKSGEVDFSDDLDYKHI